VLKSSTATAILEESEIYSPYCLLISYFDNIVDEEELFPTNLRPVR